MRVLGINGHHVIMVLDDEGNRGPECLTAPPSGPPVASCQRLRNSMPHEEVAQEFGLDRTADADIKTPFSLHAGEQMSAAH